MGEIAQNLISIRRREHTSSAILFVHGFSGNEIDTWDKFPWILGTIPDLFDWDIFSIGYSTSLMPDFKGIWTADPDIPLISKHLETDLKIEPLQQYESLCILAHSMGGLAVQHALVSDSKLVKRVKYVFLFGTPSAGLKKAGLARFWKPQFKNMGTGSSFISDLRNRWSTLFDENREPFKLRVIAGEKDQFVPPESSLRPFKDECQAVISGDHLSIIKPKNGDSENIRLVVSSLRGEVAPRINYQRVKTLIASGDIKGLHQVVASQEWTGKDLVSLALEMDAKGMRRQAIEFLQPYTSVDTDIQGTLGGRLKRRWLEEGQDGDANWALGLYQDGLRRAQFADDHDQIYYHAINVAFLEFVALERTSQAQKMARLALRHCRQSKPSVWRFATEGEANLYLGKYQTAINAYYRAIALSPESWQLLSMGHQAFLVASKLKNTALVSELETLFNPSRL